MPAARSKRYAYAIKVCAGLCGLALFASVNASAQTRSPQTRSPKAAAEYVPHSQGALATLEVEVTDAAGAAPARQAVTDAKLFISKPGGDVAAALAAGDGAAAPAGSKSLFSVRLFIVAGGRLYSGARGQCGPWESDVSRCQASCEGGTFAIRRHGAAPVELLLGAIPGGTAGAGPGLTITGCGLEEDTEAKLVPKGGRGLAVAGFGSD